MPEPTHLMDGHLHTIASDGVSVVAIDEGIGPCVLIVHGGLGDTAAWTPVAELLAERFRVLRLHRRRYRLDLDQANCTIAAETLDLRAVVAALDRPVLVVCHASGAVVVLEALSAGLPGVVGAVLFDPPVLYTDGEFDGPAGRARDDLASGHPRRALSGFLRDFVQLPGTGAWVAGWFATIAPRLRRYVAGQVGDAEAMNALGGRLDTYAAIEVPVLLLTGDRSPTHLGERAQRLAQLLPHARLVTLTGQGHGANSAAPERLAKEISDFAGGVLPLG